MTEYIEREAFMETVKDIPMWGSVAAMMADCIPAADVAPVRHGWWKFVEQRFYDGGFVNMFRCSECKYPVDREYNYCPNCGARMDLGGAE